MSDRIIQKVWQNGSSGQKLVTIPADSDVEPGDYVEITELD